MEYSLKYFHDFKEGVFTGLVEQTGKATAEMLHEVAKNHYDSIN